jgi:ABC-type antimicrobial peptide transport system permease subunit
VVRVDVKRLDPNLPLADIGTCDDVVSRSVSSQRMNSFVLVTFSGFALLLASMGIYGVLSYSVSRRTSEIGLRMALGASESSILRNTIGQGLFPVLVCIPIGGALAPCFSHHLT